MKKSKFWGLFIITFLIIGSWACEKKGNFIDEDKVGTGIHYYPVILNENYLDTVTNKYFSDTTFVSDQSIVFQLNYRSQDSVSRLELWIGENGKKTQKVLEIPYSPSFYSEYRQCDTILFSFKLPENIDSTVHSLTLTPTIVTRKGLEAESNFTLELKL